MLDPLPLLIVRKYLIPFFKSPTSARKAEPEGGSKGGLENRTPYSVIRWEGDPPLQSGPRGLPAALSAPTRSSTQDAALPQPHQSSLARLFRK